MPWVLGWWTQKDFNTKPLAYRKYADPIGLTIGYWYWYQQNGSWNEICTWYWLFVFSSFQDPFFVWYSSHCPCRLVWLPSHKNLASNRLLADQTRTMTWFHHSQFRAIFLCVCVLLLGFRQGKIYPKEPCIWVQKIVVPFRISQK